ncbi:hypothetical protein ALC53_04810, partial [Atta colombica]
PVELYLHGVTCPINREHYSPVDGLRIRWRVARAISIHATDGICVSLISIPFGTALGLARSRLHANPKSTAPCGMSSATAAAETTGGSQTREASRDFNPRYIPRRNNAEGREMADIVIRLIYSLTYLNARSAWRGLKGGRVTGWWRSDDSVAVGVLPRRGSEANVDDGESKRRAAQLPLQQSTYEVGTLPDYIDSFTLKIRAANCVYYKSGTSASHTFSVIKIV